MLGGQIMGMGEELGLIRAGYLADLLLIDGNPLKDIRLLQDRARMLLIMKDGALYKNSLKIGLTTDIGLSCSKGV